MVAAAVSLLGLLAASCGSGSSSTAAPACVGRAGSAGEAVRELDSEGRARRFRLLVPESYRRGVPAPLVFDFHGFASDGAEQMARSELRATAAANGFVLVTPDGFGGGWNAEVCCGETVGLGVDDVQFVRDMVAAVEADYCIDRRRIYAAGYSNGGLFSIFLACRADDLIAAAASVAAASLEASACVPSRPVPVLFLNGTADPVVPYAVAPPSAATWRQIDGCSDASRISYQRGDSICETWDACEAGTEVGLCTVDGGGHTWPGGGPFPDFLGAQTQDLAASDEIWAFFSRHTAPAAE